MVFLPPDSSKTDEIVAEAKITKKEGYRQILKMLLNILKSNPYNNKSMEHMN